MLLPSMKAVIPLICSLGSLLLGQKMSDLKSEFKFLLIEALSKLPGERIAFVSDIELFIISVQGYVEASFGCSISCCIEFLELLVTALQL